MSARLEAIERMIALLCITWGAAWVYRPAGPIVFGVGLLALSWFDRRT